MMGHEPVLVVVPAWNEEKSIGSVILELKRYGFDVLVVDDGSTDGTRGVALSCEVEVVTLPFNLGVGAAVRCGLRYAVAHRYRTVVQCDADGQHPISSINHLLDELRNKSAHMVIGSRFLQGVGLMRVSRIRRFAMYTLGVSASKASRTRITDATSGFRAITEPLLGELSRSMPPYYLGDTYEALVSAGRAGYRILEVPAALSERNHGTSSAHPFKAARFAVKAILIVALHIHQGLKGPESQT